MNYYTTEKINDRMTAVRTLSGEIMYLVEGTDRAILIDTGLGITGLRKFVENLMPANKPITVLISHGHLDHAMGAPEFAECYMSHRDIPTYQGYCALAGRKESVASGAALQGVSVPDVDYVPPTPDYPFIDLTDGMTFELGGISVVACETPGHTPGCFTFLIPEERILITGDACNNCTFLFEDICLSVADYQKSMISLRERTQGKYDRVFVMHHIMDAPTDLLDQMIDLCDQVKAGRTDNIPFTFMGYHAVQAMAANERMERTDGKFANLIFNPERIK